MIEDAQGEDSSASGPDREVRVREGGEGAGFVHGVDMDRDWTDKPINHLIRDDTRIEIDGRIFTKADLLQPDEPEP